MKYLSSLLIITALLFCSNCKDKPKTDAPAVALKATSPKELIQTLVTDADPDIRAAAARQLGEQKAKEALPDLIKALENDDDKVRQQIVPALGKIGGPQSYKALTSVWHGAKESSEMKGHALKAIGSFSTDEAVNLLNGVATSGNDSHQAIAIEALGNTNSPKAAAIIARALTAKSDNLPAAQALVKLKQKSSYDSIVALLERKAAGDEFDRTFLVLAEFMGDEKNLKAQNALAKVYLKHSSMSPDSMPELRKIVTNALVNMKAKGIYCIVNGDVLNVRANPNTRAEVRGKVLRHELADVIEVSPRKYTVEGMEDYWYKIRTKTRVEGWVYGGFLKVYDLSKLTRIN